MRTVPRRGRGQLPPSATPLHTQEASVPPLSPARDTRSGDPYLGQLLTVLAEQPGSVRGGGGARAAASPCRCRQPGLRPRGSRCGHGPPIPRGRRAVGLGSVLVVLLLGAPERWGFERCLSCGPPHHAGGSAQVRRG